MSATHVMSEPLADPAAEGLRIIEAARAASLEVFLLGGVAVKVRAPDGRPLIERPFNDVDIVTSRSAGREITRLLRGLGYEPDAEFNAINGRTRMLFRDERNGRDLDVLVGEFAMCHELPILEQARLDEATIPLADLLLTKLQIIEINAKDVVDAYNLLHAHAVGEGNDAIAAARIARLCARDWGLWRTVTRNLDRLLEPSYRPDVAPGVELVGARIATLREAIDAEGKSRRWQLRARVGDRVRWYEEPEEAH